MYNYERFIKNGALAKLMEEESIFLEHVGDNPRMRTLQYFIEGRDFDYTLTDLLNAGVSWGTLNQLVHIIIFYKSRQFMIAPCFETAESQFIKSFSQASGS